MTTDLPLSVQVLPASERAALAKGARLAARLMLEDWLYGMAGREAGWTRHLAQRLEDVARALEVAK